MLFAQQEGLQPREVCRLDDGEDVLVEEAKDVDTVRDTAGENDLREEAFEELRRHCEEVLAMQRWSTEDDRRASVGLVVVRWWGQQRA